MACKRSRVRFSSAPLMFTPEAVNQVPFIALPGLRPVKVDSRQLHSVHAGAVNQVPFIALPGLRPVKVDSGVCLVTHRRLRTRQIPSVSPGRSSIGTVCRRSSRARSPGADIRSAKATVPG
jgi:hypothetical protein